MAKKIKPSASFLMRNLKWFAKNITALHGISKLGELRGTNLFLWGIVIIANTALTASFIVIAKNKYNDDSIVTQINANCNVSQVPFPAVSICNNNLVSHRESRRIAAILLTNGISEVDIDSFFHALPYLKDYQSKSTLIGNFTHIMSILKYHYYSVDTIMAEVHQKCNNLLLYCSFNRKEKNCSEIFHMIKTLEGYCCTFNYGGANDASDNPLQPEDSDFEYYIDDDEDTGPMPHKLIVTAEFGRVSGLLVVFDVEAEDYPPYSIALNYGAKILVNDAYDYPETTTMYHLSTPGESADIKVEPRIFQVDSQVRNVHPSRRRCWFHDEVHLDHTDRYSYETCYTECRMQSLLDHCGCLPYKYPKEKLKRICELEDLKCLNNVTATISDVERNCNPICYVECADKKYGITENANSILSVDLPAHLTKSHNIEQLSAVHVYYGKSSVNCYKLTLLMDTSYFIATYGGVFSLSFGGSIMTVVELLYLTCRFIIITVYFIVQRLKSKIFKRNYIHKHGCKK